MNIRNLGVNEVRLASAFLSGSFPLWVRRIHFVNQPRSFLLLIKFYGTILSIYLKGFLEFL